MFFPFFKLKSGTANAVPAPTALRLRVCGDLTANEHNTQTSFHFISSPSKQRQTGPLFSSSHFQVNKKVQ